MKKIICFLAIIVALIGIFMTGIKAEEKSKVLILMGPPGAGKGTHAVELKKSLKIPHISTGDLFRENLQNNTPLGKEAKKYMEKGLLVPDEIVEKMVFERVLKDDCKKGYILDGFPRTIHQTKSLENFLKKDKKIKTTAINLSAKENLLIERITKRIVCRKCKTPYHKKFLPPKKENICDICSGELYQRKDDTEEIVKRRLVEYNEKTKPILDYYKKEKKLLDVDANNEKEKVFEDILEALKKN